MDSSAAEPGRLRWRCRRGMKELDLLLVRWLDRRYPAAGPAERAAFARLLEAQDPQLVAWLLKGEPAPDVELQGLVDELLALPV
ncbi:MAG: succinate dehydrogenase assembly factor 2 [Steroidobacteraceae bacterium]|nr:succinate dehydrogenase assembly factor 2 [Steroidobacteraceae bacterium]